MSLHADRAEGSDTELDLDDNASDSAASERSETESEPSPEHRTTLSRFSRPQFKPGACGQASRLHAMLHVLSATDTELLYMHEGVVHALLITAPLHCLSFFNGNRKTPARPAAT